MASSMPRGSGLRIHRGYYSWRRRLADGNDGRTDGDEGEMKATGPGADADGKTDKTRTGSAERKLDGEEKHNGGLREREKGYCIVMSKGEVERLGGKKTRRDALLPVASAGWRRRIALGKERQPKGQRGRHDAQSPKGASAQRPKGAVYLVAGARCGGYLATRVLAAPFRPANQRRARPIRLAPAPWSPFWRRARFERLKSST
jgi:hypothetical protein